MAQNKKIMVFVPAASGHVNPICGLIHELCKNKNIEVLFYSDEAYRDVIEKAGAKFRLNEAPTFSKVDPKIFASKMQFSNLLDITIDFAFDQLPQYIAEVEKEKPDLILYDGLSFSAKYLIEVIKARHANGDKSIPIPKTALFSPNFPFSEKMIKFLNDRNEDIWTTLGLVNTIRKQFVLSWYYGISVYNPIRIFKEMNHIINLVGINPELQPDRNDFDDTLKFVGTCTSEESRSVDLKQDPELNAFLTQFDNKPKDLKLIFFSMGTLFHTKFYVIEKAVEAFIKYDENRNRRFKLRDFKIIISVGAPGLKKFNEKISNGELVLPKNILLRASVPQLEVLKRADLFITHCGMNSTLETIKYGVPVVALPLNVDQPLNAFRICDELNFGVCLDPESFTIDKLNDSIDQVLSDWKFKDNIERMSKISAKYNGAIDGAKILIDYLYEQL